MYDVQSIFVYSICLSCTSIFLFQFDYPGEMARAAHFFVSDRFRSWKTCGASKNHVANCTSTPPKNVRRLEATTAFTVWRTEAVSISPRKRGYGDLKKSKRKNVPENISSAKRVKKNRILDYSFTAELKIRAFSAAEEVSSCGINKRLRTDSGELSRRDGVTSCGAARSYRMR